MALAAAVGIGLLMLPPIAQDQEYHRFAGDSTWPNVLSNLPFIGLGIYGLTAWRRSNWEWRAVSIGAVLIGFGSGYYHATPSDATLYWDRLPMTIAFMGVIAAMIADRIDERAGLWLLIPLILFGMASVEVWRQTGDLRFYVFVQFYPVIGLPYLLLAFPERKMPNGPIWALAACYTLAKALEAGDERIYVWTGEWVAGHPLKHLVAAAGLYFPLRRV